MGRNDSINIVPLLNNYKSNNKGIMQKEGVKQGFHKRNKHNKNYNFPELIIANPELERFVHENQYGDLSIDFFDSHAVKALNKALLFYFYNLSFWDIPQGSLCPPIPSRADYIHNVADLIGDNLNNKKIKCVDIGVGSNCIYPIIGAIEYGWDFVGSEINNDSIINARRIVEMNENLRDKIEIRHQEDPFSIFRGIIKQGEYFDLSICNPPFHNSNEEAKQASRRKESNLKHIKVNKPNLNFNGQENELWCKGGELSFIKYMIEESHLYRNNVNWFTTLVSNEDNLPKLIRVLKDVCVKEHKIIPMEHGNKKTRILAWRF